MILGLGYSRGLGKRLASPEGIATETFPISDFLSKGSWNYDRVSPGTYVTKSSIRLWRSTSYDRREQEQVGGEVRDDDRACLCLRLFCELRSRDMENPTGVISLTTGSEFAVAR